MSNKPLPTAIEHLDSRGLTYLRVLFDKRNNPISVSELLEEYAELKCKELREENERLSKGCAEVIDSNYALREENERLRHQVNDFQELLLCLIDGNLCSAAGDDVIKQALKGE